MKLFVPYVSGKPLESIVARWFNADGQALVVSGEGAGSLEPFNADNLATYLVEASAEQAGLYVIDVPAGGEALRAVVFDGESEAVIGILDPDVRNLLEADRHVDTSNAEQWELVLVQRGTGGVGEGTELLRQKLFDAAGQPLRSERTIVGGAAYVSESEEE